MVGECVCAVNYLSPSGIKVKHEWIYASNSSYALMDNFSFALPTFQSNMLSQPWSLNVNTAYFSQRLLPTFENYQVTNLAWIQMHKGSIAEIYWTGFFEKEGKY